MAGCQSAVLDSGSRLDAMKLTTEGTRSMVTAQNKVAEQFHSLRTEVLEGTDLNDQAIEQIKRSMARHDQSRPAALPRFRRRVCFGIHPQNAPKFRTKVLGLTRGGSDSSAVKE